MGKTGMTVRLNVWFTTPAAAVYQANAAVTIPVQPSSLMIVSLLPHSPITSRMNVTSSAVNTPSAWGSRETIIKLDGWTGIVTAALAWYTAAAGVVNHTFKRTVIPVFPIG